MSEQNSRRGFLKAALVGAGAATALFASVKFDAADGVKIGKSSVKVGMSEAMALCGQMGNCSGGRGWCGPARNCSGSGGACGWGSSCGGR